MSWERHKIKKITDTTHFENLNLILIHISLSTQGAESDVGTLQVQQRLAKILFPQIFNCEANKGLAKMLKSFSDWNLKCSLKNTKMIFKKGEK